MEETITWGFTIPTFIILCLVALIVWLVQDRTATLDALRARLRAADLDAEGSTTVGDSDYHEGISEGLLIAIDTIEKGKRK